jgi:hypothetical protein
MTSLVGNTNHKVTITEANPFCPSLRSYYLRTVLTGYCIIVKIIVLLYLVIFCTNQKETTLPCQKDLLVLKLVKGRMPP